MTKSEKMGKITKHTRVQVPNPFSIETHKTERTVVAVLMHWMRQIIETRNLDLGLPDVETGGEDKKFPDTLIHKTRRSQDVLCVIECKPPFWDPFTVDGFKEDARKKATHRKARYFVTTNFRELILWNTGKVNANKPEEEQIVARYHLSDIFDLNQIEDNRFQAPTKVGLENFLNDLYELSVGKKAEIRHSIDELLIYRLHEKINKLAYYYKSIIYDTAHKDPVFAKSVTHWFADQGWAFFIETEHDYEKIARQTAYLLVNKILFYNALQLKRPDKLDPLAIPDDITKGGMLKGVLLTYFNEVLKIDYQTIYTTDFIDEVAFQDGREVVEEVKELVRTLGRYDFSTLGFDIIGRVFERLIPPKERRNLGQYFTNPDVVDLILQFCVRHEDDKVLDPSCGAGTFLVRSYVYKKLMNQRLEHEKILDDIWGNDIAKFPAHLATINLAINDLSVEQNYPNIIQKDFFDLLTTNDGFELPENVRKVKARALDISERDVMHPRWFDAVVGNPPYTRQEEISEISDEVTYKDKLIQKALMQGDKVIANISKRAGIYAYFFIHGTKFLRNGGRFGFVVSNAWLDVEYGAGLQEFFLKNYKIVAVIESKVERWFEDADINTVIVILEKAVGNDKKKERDDNLVRFVYLSKPLRHFIPAAQNIWEREVERKQAIDNLIKTVLGHSELYQNDELRIFPKKQSELWEEGFDEESKKYIGAKWGKYLRAPEIFFKILEKGKNKLVPLKQVASVRFGVKTGANDFFYLTKEDAKSWGIEPEYLQPIIFSLKEVRGYAVTPEDLSRLVILCCKQKEQLKSTNLLKYIKRGEGIGYHKRPTCASRKPDPWYCLAKKWKYAPLIFPAKVGERMPIFFSNHIYEDKKLYGITPKNNEDTKLLATLLNSTLTRFFIEFTCRQLTGAQAIADIDVIVVQQCPIISLSEIEGSVKKKLARCFSELLKNESVSIFKEIGTKNVDEINLSRIVSFRRNIDKIVMGDILGLSEDEQLEVYRAVIDLVKSRLARARSVGSRSSSKSGIDIESVVNTIVEKVGPNDLKSWYKENVLSGKGLRTVALPEAVPGVIVEKSLFGWQVKVGKQVVKCQSEFEARYLRIWIEVGASSVKIPKDDGQLKRLVASLEKRKAEIDEIIKDYLGSILDAKLKARILHQVWQRLI